MNSKQQHKHISMDTKKKRVYRFGGKTAEGDGSMRNLLGGKGANLAEMCRLGIPVPAGFTITTECCAEYYELCGGYTDALKEEVAEALKATEAIMGKKFGDKNDPLLVSCRSGARTSMPGMMDTILNIGLCSETIPGMIKKTGNPRFVYDAYRRLIMMYSDVVMEKAEGIEPAQLWGSIGGVFKSWNGKRAIAYRKIEGIPDDWGTAVNVQSMVFGNMGNTSATGVAFSRNPANGDNRFYGEWLINAQGEDVVAGIRTPNPLNEATKNPHNANLESLEKAMPEVYKELDSIRLLLEDHFKDMQDIEFTIQDGKLWMLQCRIGKRTGLAALNMAMDMVHEGMIDEKTAVMRVSPSQLDEILHPILDPASEKKAKAIATGLPASPGGAVGKVVFTSEDAMDLNAKGEKAILVREETSPEDVEGMRAAAGILTARGGMTSHAALVARGWGKCCIVGCDTMHISLEDRVVRFNNKEFHEGDVISLNGSKGIVYGTPVDTMDATENPRFIEFMNMVDKYRKLGVRTNADTPEDAERALSFGAEGIGLFRIEHMFYGKNSETPLAKLRKMILSRADDERRSALAELEPFIKASVKSTMRVMDGKPVTFRLLDPPLHEFVPQTTEKREELAKELGISEVDIEKRGESLHEVNPMMGHRGVRLHITYPMISETQFRAIFTAAAELIEEGLHPMPEIMIPVTISDRELNFQKAICDRVKAEVEGATIRRPIDYKYGTMIEIPRAALIADRMARTAEFFSFGTNDLTQMTFGFSRDDVGTFMGDYLGNKILDADPFQTIDKKAVGKLIEIGVKGGRSTRPDLKVGICGEHGGDPASVEFCYKIGLNYVSCSPFRVPIARLAAAQAAIREEAEK